MTPRKAATTSVVGVLAGTFLVVLVVAWAAASGPGDLLRGEGSANRPATGLSPTVSPTIPDAAPLPELKPLSDPDPDQVRNATIGVVLAVLLYGAGIGLLLGLGTAALLSVLLWWGLSVRTDLPLAVVPAAFALLAAHLAGLAADLGPGRMSLDRAVARLWLLRGTALAAAPPVVWLLVTLARDGSDSDVPNLLGVVVLAAALAGTGGTLAVRERS